MNGSGFNPLVVQKLICQCGFPKLVCDCMSECVSVTMTVRVEETEDKARQCEKERGRRKSNNNETNKVLKKGEGTG